MSLSRRKSMEGTVGGEAGPFNSPLLKMQLSIHKPPSLKLSESLLVLYLTRKIHQQNYYIDPSLYLNV